MSSIYDPSNYWLNVLIMYIYGCRPHQNTPDKTCTKFGHATTNGLPSTNKAALDRKYPHCGPVKVSQRPRLSRPADLRPSEPGRGRQLWAWLASGCVYSFMFKHSAFVCSLCAGDYDNLSQGTNRRVSLRSTCSFSIKPHPGGVLLTALPLRFFRLPENGRAAHRRF